MYLKRFYDEQARAGELPGRLRSARARRSSSTRTATSSSTSTRRPRAGLRDHARDRDAHPRRLRLGRRELAARTGAKLYLSDEGGDGLAVRLRRGGRRACCSSDGDRFTVGNIAHRGDAHARPHAGAPRVPGHRHRGGGPADGRRSPATSSSSATSAGPTCSSGGRRGGHDGGRRARRSSTRSQRVQGAAGLPADLAGPRRRLGVRQGARRDAAVARSATRSCSTGRSRSTDEEEFVRAVLAGQPEPPRYFAEMKRINRDGPRILGGFRRPGAAARRRGSTG